MKKMLTGIVLCASLCVLASCSKNAQKMNVKQTIDAAKNMSHDELVAKAKEEAAAAKSAGTVFKAYGTSSRIASAAKAFTELYGIDVETTNVKDSEIYTKLQA